MGTVYDLISLILFAGLAVLYLQRSSSAEPKDKIIHYAPPAIGCGVANWLGNQRQDLFAIIAILAVIAYSVIVLKPFSRTP